MRLINELVLIDHSMHELKIILMIIYAILGAENSHCQNITQVIHSTGTQNYNGINVTVSSIGGAGIWTTYCPSVTFPYLIGHDFTSNNDLNGSYIFQFNPPVESIVLNVSAIGTIHQNDLEIVKISVNNAHYPLFSLGVPNDCDSIALVNSEGDLINEHGKPSGLKDIYIPGPVSLISISDSIVAGLGGGSMFSLYFSKLNLSSLESKNIYDLQFYPNPTSNKIYLKNIPSEINEVKLVNMMGETFPFKFEVDEKTMVLDFSEIDKGIYNLQFLNEHYFISKIIIIE